MIMKKILFVCHGNICRSPMSEFVMKALVKERGLQDEFYIESAATSTEELGNPVYPPARQKLAEHGISTVGKYARQVESSDFEHFDYIVGMDRYNILNLKRVAPRSMEYKISLLLEHAGLHRDVADPWYTGDFEATWQDVNLGCSALLDKLIL